MRICEENCVVAGLSRFVRPGSCRTNQCFCSSLCSGRTSAVCASRLQPGRPALLTTTVAAAFRSPSCLYQRPLLLFRLASTLDSRHAHLVGSILRFLRPLSSYEILALACAGF